MRGKVLCRIPFDAAFEARGDLRDDASGQGEGVVLGSGDGDYVAWVEEDPECVATDTAYFGVPFFVGTGDVALEKEVVGWGLGRRVCYVGEDCSC